MKPSVARRQPVTFEVRENDRRRNRVRRAGERTLPLVQKYGGELFTVEEKKSHKRDSSCVLEAQKRWPKAPEQPHRRSLKSQAAFAGQRVAVLVCGGNIDVTLLSRIIERGLVKDVASSACAFTCPTIPARCTGNRILAGNTGPTSSKPRMTAAYHGVNLGDTAIASHGDPERPPDHIAELLAALVFRRLHARENS